MDSRTAKLINCLLKRVKKLELNSNNNSNNNSIFDLKDFTTKNFNENEIDDAFDQLRVYFKGQNLLVCLIGIDETLSTDDTFRHTLSNSSLGNGNLKHYSSDISVIESNNFFNELDDNMKPFVNLINGLELELTVGDTKMTHVGCSFLKRKWFRCGY